MKRRVALVARDRWASWCLRAPRWLWRRPSLGPMEPTCEWRRSNDNIYGLNGGDTRKALAAMTISKAAAATATQCSRNAGDDQVWGGPGAMLTTLKV